MKFISKFLNPFFKHNLLVLVVFLAIFAIQRATLLFLNWDYFSSAPAFTLFQSFIVGLRFDARSSLYLISAYFLFAYIFYFFRLQKTAKYFSIIYLSLSAYIFSLLGIVEFYFFDYFHIRLNSYTLNTFENPAFVFKMLWESYPIIPLLLGSGLFFFLFYKLFNALSERYFISFKEDNFIYKLLGFAAICMISFIGIRGTFEKMTPLRWGHAFFSEYTQANQLALNCVFTLVDDISHKSKKGSFKEYLQVTDLDKAKSIASKLIQDSSSITKNFPLRIYDYSDSTSNQKPNVVLFLLESFSQKKLDKRTAKGYDLFYNRLAKNSLDFKNCYSNGFHTYMGLFSTISSLPNVHAINIMKRTEGRQKLSSLPAILKDNGYTTYFAVSHVPNFDNLGGFMSINGTDEIISELDFDQSEVISSLGIADHVLFEKMNETFASSKAPFFATILSTNNHGPWIIPVVENKTFDDTFIYTDWALEHFFDLAAKEKYFENTIFIVTADHGIPEDGIYDFDLSATQIPLIFYSPKYIKADTISNIMSQMDISETLLGMLKLPHQTCSYSRNILSLENNDNGFALVQEGSKIGFIYDDWYIIDRLGSDPSLYKYRSDNPKHDYAKDSTNVVDALKRKLHSLYYLSNEMIYSMKASPEAYK